MTDTIVLCKDCKHYHRTIGMVLGGTDARCKRNYIPTVNLVSGKVKSIDYYSLDKCYNERTDDYKSNCGSRGMFWTPRKPNPKTTMLMLKRLEMKYETN